MLFLVRSKKRSRHPRLLRGQRAIGGQARSEVIQLAARSRTPLAPRSHFRRLLGGPLSPPVLSRCSAAKMRRVAEGERVIARGTPIRVVQGLFVGRLGLFEGMRRPEHCACLLSSLTVTSRKETIARALLVILFAQAVSPPTHQITPSEQPDRRWRNGSQPRTSAAIVPPRVLSTG